MRGDIRSWDKALETRCNWSWINGAFGGTRISVSDVDFLIERKGQFLIGEVKPSRSISQGQTLTFKSLAAIPQITAFFLVGSITEHEIEPVEILVMGEGWRKITRTGFYEFCARWFLCATEGRCLSCFGSGQGFLETYDIVHKTDICIHEPCRDCDGTGKRGFHY